MRKTVCDDIISCDRCGRNFEDVDKPWKSGYGSISMEIIIFRCDDAGKYNDGPFNEYKDLCVDCAEELLNLTREFMKRKKKT